MILKNEFENLGFLNEGDHVYYYVVGSKSGKVAVVDKVGIGYVELVLLTNNKVRRIVTQTGMNQRRFRLAFVNPEEHPELYL